MAFNVDQYIKNLNTEIQTGFKLTPDNNYDMENRKLTNVQNGDAEGDVMVKRQIEGYDKDKTRYLDGVLPAQVLKNKAVIYSPSGGVHANSLYLKDQNGQEVHFFNENQDDNQIRLYIPNLKNNDSYGGRLKSSVVVTSIDQTIEGKKVFTGEIEVPTAVTEGQATNKKYVDDALRKVSGINASGLVKKSGDTMTGPLIVPPETYPVRGNLNKVISYETQREIFLSKKEGGKMSQPIDMGGFPIENLKTPTEIDHAVNKNYVDQALGQKVNTKLTYPATKDLSMGSFKFANLATPTTHENDAAINVSFFNTELNKSNTNMSTQLTNAYKQYVNESHLKLSGQQKDVFRYLMEDKDESSSESNVTVTGIKDWPQSPHNINKKAYEFTLTKDKDNEYRSRISFNIHPVPVGDYTLIMEYFPPEMRSVTVSTESTTAYVEKQSSKNFKNCVKHRVQFSRWNSSPPQYLFIDLHGYSSSGSVGRMIVYGVKEHVNEVDPSVYDTAFVVENGKMVM